VGTANGRQHVSRRAVADALRAQIGDSTNAKYRPGAKLPSYRQLAAQHGVAVNTAMAAVQALADEGLVTIRPSSGAFVRDATGQGPALPARRDLSDLRDRLGRAKRDVAEAEKAIAALLEQMPPEVRR
jgi:DNA-binding transcriptional regulator YhcF (GntR family)